MYSYVKLKFKASLFYCIFWFEDSFLCKFTFLHLLSGLHGTFCQKIYDGRKKYFRLTNVSFQCHTSSWNTPFTIRKWFQNFTKVSGSHILCLPILVKIAVFRWQKIGLPVFQSDVWHWNETFVNPKYFFGRHIFSDESYLAIRLVNVNR